MFILMRVMEVVVLVALHRHSTHESKAIIGSNALWVLYQANQMGLLRACLLRIDTHRIYSHRFETFGRRTLHIEFDSKKINYK